VETCAFTYKTGGAPGLTPGSEYGIMREIKRLNKGWRGTTSSARKEIIR
jgi:hypothetical protein